MAFLVQCAYPGGGNGDVIMVGLDADGAFLLKGNGSPEHVSVYQQGLVSGAGRVVTGNDVQLLLQMGNGIRPCSSCHNLPGQECFPV